LIRNFTLIRGSFLSRSDTYGQDRVIARDPVIGMQNLHHGDTEARRKAGVLRGNQAAKPGTR
jgi:hypothetical protein